MAEIVSAHTGCEMDVLTPGSFVIERYIYNRANGSKGVQWCVHQVSKAGGLTQLIACNTRREAAEFIAGHRG